MNTVRKLLEENYEEIKSCLEKTYEAIFIFQKDRASEEKKKYMIEAISTATKLLSCFKPFIPAYKQRYFDILEHYEQLGLSPSDLIMTFDRAVFELHTRLEKNIALREKSEAWSTLMKDILDGRRTIMQQENKDIRQDGLEFIASGQTVVAGCVSARVRKLVKESDAAGVGRGELIAAGMTSPNIITVMDKISGIATEQGGQFCHAAVLAREFNIPCVVGCRKLLELVENGDNLILDANNGIIMKKIKK